MAASRWERGINPPTASIYIELGKLAGSPECWFFWEQAGLSKADIAAVQPKRRSTHHAPNLESVAAFTGQRPVAPGKVPTQLALPVYQTTSAIGSGQPTKIDRENVLEYSVAPRAWCPNPEQTICLRMGDETMAPILHAGDMFALDEGQSDLQQLETKMVMAQHPEQGLVVRWLQRFGKAQMLVPENHAFQPIYMENSAWKVIGRVLWWYGKGP